MTRGERINAIARLGAKLVQLRQAVARGEKVPATSQTLVTQELAWLGASFTTEGWVENDDEHDRRRRP